MSKTNEEVKLSNTHVPDKVYAYTLQVRHMMYELLECENDNDIVSVELFEDVGVQKNDGGKEAVQLKSALSDRNPVSNKAKDLWKTMHNWLLSINKKELEAENTRFIMFVTVDKQGEIVNAFNSAKDMESASNAWEKARQVFYDKDNKEKSLSDDCGVYIRYFFNTENKDAACKLIEKFTLKTINKHHTAFLFEEFRKHIYIADILIEYAFDNILGWIDRKTANQIEQGKPMVLTYKEFRNRVILVSKELNQNQSLVELATKPTSEQIKKEFDQVKTYIEQLNIIDCDYDEKIEAISDYLRASTNRTIWAQTADLNDDNISEYGDELMRFWRSEKKIANIKYKDLPPETMGALIYNDCLNYNPDIGYLRAPAFFPRGCYQALADDESIGWHPEYKKELEKRRNENGK